MAGATIPEFARVYAAVQKLDTTVQAALRQVAEDTANRAKETARIKVPHDTYVTRDSIAVVPEPENRQFRVEVGTAPHNRDGRTAFLPNLPLWLEYGTSKMEARPFLRPAMDAERERYIRDMAAAVTDVVEDIG